LDCFAGARNDEATCTHPGEVLREEFLVPLGLSAGALAKAWFRAPA
jgi:plasmid maintenance system antidote protein VapI